LAPEARVIDRIDVLDFGVLSGVLRAVNPDIIMNCVGITKRITESGDKVRNIMVNSVFPYKLVELAADLKSRVIHFSTDCVFSGDTGNYSDDALPDARDLYGRTKALGEALGDNVLILRSSFIGRELHGKTELLEWFLSQNGTVRGFKNAIYTGFTVFELSRIVERMITSYPDTSGLYNVSSEPISKYDLLKLIGETMHRETVVVPDESFHCNRSLNSDKFRKDFAYYPPSWTEMVEELSNRYEERI
jgi:dTDP-4-dehydrorhamnose reductase